MQLLFVVSFALFLKPGYKFLIRKKFIFVVEKCDWNLCAEDIHASQTCSFRMELHIAKQWFFICDTLDYSESLTEDFLRTNL